MSERTERAMEARRLREAGLPVVAIADRMEISCSYTYGLLTDPTGTKDRARKRSYGGTCQRCGSRTDGSNGSDNAPDLCQPCHQQKRHEARHWTPERIIAAFRAWNDHYGRPPLAREWVSGSGVGARPLEWPDNTMVWHELGSWNDGLRAAGLPVLRQFNRPAEHDPTVPSQAAALYASGLSLSQVAARLGVSSTRVWQWLKRLDVPRRPPGPVTRLGSAEHALTE